jgi:hypothetical protein
MKVKTKSQLSKEELRAAVISEFNDLEGRTIAKVCHLATKYNLATSTIYNYIRGNRDVPWIIKCECGWKGNRAGVKRVFKLTMGENVPVDRCPWCYKEV